MTWYEGIIAAHVAVTDAVSHGEFLQSDRYFVWQEDGANDLLADNRHVGKAVTGSTDLFTKKEFDPWKEALEESFDRHGVAFYVNSIQYEEETGFFHYEWRWEVTEHGDKRA